MNILQVKALSSEENQELESIDWLFPKIIRNIEIKNKLDDIKKLKEKINQRHLTFRVGKYEYGFQQFETIRSFCDSIDTVKSNIDEAEMDQINLLKNMLELNDKSRPRKKEDKENTFESVNAFYEAQELTFNAFTSRIFPIKAKQGKVLKILT